MRTIQLTLAVALAMVPTTSAAQARRSGGPVVGQGGPLPPAVIRRVIRRGLGPIRYCYEKALLRRPKLAGRVVVHFTISSRGRVQSSRVKSSTLGAPKVAHCVAARVRRLVFPAPLGGGIVKVNYPFVFKPTGAQSKSGKGRCKVDADCRLKICCCSWRVFGTGEPLCRPAPCACAAPVAPPPMARCAAGRCLIVPAVTPPTQSPSKDRACKRDGDCVFEPRSGCGCPPCGPTWRSAANRKHAAWLRREYARESCPRHKCAKCRRPLRWLGSRTVCHRGQCAVRP
jgi:TonB family protein